jgi:hypothetical protein
MGGIQFLFFGLLGEMVSRTYFESQAKSIYLVRKVKRQKPPLSEGATD